MVLLPWDWRLSFILRGAVSAAARYETRLDTTGSICETVI